MLYQAGNNARQVAEELFASGFGTRGRANDWGRGRWRKCSKGGSPTQARKKPAELEVETARKARRSMKEALGGTEQSEALPRIAWRL